MSDARVIIGGIAAAAVAVGAAFFLYVKSTGSASAAEDGPGPNLVIEVAGEANGKVTVDLLPDIAPKHVAQVTELARRGAYDGVVFHRVIEGFMAQTGDVQNGKAGGDLALAGTGASDLPNIPAEFSEHSFMRGVVGMARSADPDSANSQFFIMFAPGEFLNGQYTVIGHVIGGMEVVDAIKKGNPDLNGAVSEPDRMVTVTVEE
ncbi:peptidylprolyl isomerase [Defluviimonas sp. WL0024]|uniref:Peptidyl-prolyl cis-trans isomerase n=2 Tax=Albidovulum TaxID=205889 RepID=A0ABT3J3H1_9RHOB|nr:MULTISPECIES: peptidylprolyl isomerase [Defluviimonas]MCU9848694.1 peptidylprolyl isomerase [Defluviimonas sp. WL0024]MCW3782241.1 peptidylprolyl isomerase [Defluviimonas salinarum]